MGPAPAAGGRLGSASRLRTSRGPGRCGPRGSAAAPRLPVRGASGTDGRPGRAARRPAGTLGWPARSPRQPRASAERVREAAAEVAECAPPLAPAAAAPLRQSRRVPAAAAAAAARAPRAPGTGFPGWAGPPPLPHLPAGRGAVLPAPPGIPSRLAHRSLCAAGGADPLRQTRASSQNERHLDGGGFGGRRTLGLIAK
ncbi:translation initiation factor IF-2-like [Ursus arctos]|uniref:translation initiation factor IF-2-like n=1 Tax=Ursus arctos TaxID=9644 RepID=UPI002017D3CC|nr:translation initiation factor IF-2-like [Ursus arctos]